MTTQADVIAALEVFRSCFASDLTMLTARQESHCGRAAAQEGLQLVWSFVAADSPIDEAGDSLLRAAFPDEMFGNDAQGAFDKLRGSVDDAYADIWKHSASEQLAALVVACATTGTEEPIYRYRDSALRLAALTCDLHRPVTGRMVGEVGRFNGMLRRVVALTEVAVAESTILEVEQVREFSARPTAHGSIALDFLGLLKRDLAEGFLRSFVDQFGTDTARDLLDESLSQDLNSASTELIEALIPLTEG